MKITGLRIRAAIAALGLTTSTLTSPQTLPAVYVVSSPFSDSSTISPAYTTPAASQMAPAYSFSVGMAIAASAAQAVRAADVRIARVSPEARGVTGKSEMVNRWLAAQEVFNSLQSEGLLTHYFRATASLAFSYEGVTYKGFLVTYADGSRETWAIMPNYATSSMKLFDHPLPGSLRQP